jgi:hypothetical protein
MRSCLSMTHRPPEPTMLSPRCSMRQALIAVSLISPAETGFGTGDRTVCAKAVARSSSSSELPQSCASAKQKLKSAALRRP